MPAKGRPRLSPDELQARIAAYCTRYGVAPNAEGLPPFPTGRRETRQHREWIAVYKAHGRLARRARGQCERCGAPVDGGHRFCRAHESDAARLPATADERRALLEAQGGRCPICSEPLSLEDTPDRGRASGAIRGLLHPRCHQLVAVAEPFGPRAAARLRAYLWPRTRTQQ